MSCHAALPAFRACCLDACFFPHPFMLPHVYLSCFRTCLYMAFLFACLLACLRDASQGLTWGYAHPILTPGFRWKGELPRGTGKRRGNSRHHASHRRWYLRKQLEHYCRALTAMLRRLRASLTKTKYFLAHENALIHAESTSTNSTISRGTIG